ncbi:hypothetical protein [Streptosporangium subroseum]|uniref:hypothetical protein n=1 Tax=Streptosporangium subroseum TaxID=106412 RepID=UPI00308873F2|nr:hypothetical protein OHB15_23250 [Streptosporangium subroseum]
MIGALIAGPGRRRILLALKDGRALPAGRLRAFPLLTGLTAARSPYRPPARPRPE